MRKAAKVVKFGNDIVLLLRLYFSSSLAAPCTLASKVAKLAAARTAHPKVAKLRHRTPHLVSPALLRPISKVAKLSFANDP